MSEDLEKKTKGQSEAQNPTEGGREGYRPASSFSGNRPTGRTPRPASTHHSEPTQHDRRHPPARMVKEMPRKAHRHRVRTGRAPATDSREAISRAAATSHGSSIARATATTATDTSSAKVDTSLAATISHDSREDTVRATMPTRKAATSHVSNTAHATITTRRLVTSRAATTSRDSREDTRAAEAMDSHGSRVDTTSAEVTISVEATTSEAATDSSASSVASTVPATIPTASTA